MTAPDRVDVLICGAGPAGLTLAIDLARRGVSFRLIDRAQQPSAGSRGKGLQPRTLEVFEDLGVVDRIVANGGAYPPLRTYAADGSHADTVVAEPASTTTAAEPYTAPIMVMQSLTEGVLRKRLAELGHGVEFGCELTGLTQDDDGVAATVVQEGAPQTVHARYLIGTDGGRSFVRHAVGIAFPGKTLGVRALVADLDLTGLDRSVWHRFNEQSMETQIGLCPLAGTPFFQLQAPVPLEGAVDTSVAGLNRFIGERVHTQLIHIRSVEWASVYSMSERLADRFRVGRVFLAGDAAHVHPPTGGQGLNTSVQDAYNLGWKLAAVLGGAPDELLDTYEEERRPIAAAMLNLSVRLLDAHKRGEMRRGREVHQLDLGYAGSSLARASTRPARIAAGNRAPDANVRGAGGQPLRLFERFRGPQWTLLGCDVRREHVPARPNLHVHTVGEAAELHDDAGQFQQAYGLERDHWVLIRPDGYVATVVSSAELPSLGHYLDSVGVQAQRTT